MCESLASQMCVVPLLDIPSLLTQSRRNLTFLVIELDLVPLPVARILLMIMIVVAHHVDTVLAVTGTAIGAHPAVAITMMTAAAMAAPPHAPDRLLMITHLPAAAALTILTVATTHQLTHMRMAMEELLTIDPLRETIRLEMPAMLTMIAVVVTGNFSCLKQHT